MMESLSSCNLTSDAPFNTIHPIDPCPRRIPGINGRRTSFVIKASAVPLYPHAPPNQRPRKYQQRDAFPNSIPLHSKNPHAVYRDIQRFAAQNKLKEALAIIDYLEHRGVPTNVTTFSSLISACSRSKSVDYARQVHVHIRINGLEENEFLQTKLVQMYTACGSIEDARKVFDEMPVTTVYPWNALLRGHVMLGHRSHHEALVSFWEMRSSGIELNIYSFSCLIKSLAGARALRQGLKAHGILIKNGLLGSCIVRTSLIDMYFKCGKIKLACSIFDEIEEKDVVVWGAMIAGFAHNRLHREALDYLRLMASEGIVVNSVVLTSIIPVIGELFSQKLGREVHGYVIKTREYSKRPFIQSALIDMYCKCGDMVSGRKVFYGSAQRNTVCWTALLSGYITNGRLHQALRSIIWMQQEGFRPDFVTIATVLPVCGKLGAMRQGKEIHAYGIKNGFTPRVSVATSLMMMYSKCRNLEYCVKIFDNMETQNVISWTAMIECYIEYECYHDALGVFRMMQLSKHRPDSVTIARILTVCGTLEVQKLGKEVHCQALKKCLESVPFVSAEIVRMYGMLRIIDKVKLAFDTVPVKGSMVWTAVIDAYGCNDLFEEALSLFKQMIADGLSPNQFTFNVVLRICEQGGLVDDALRFFALMTQKYKIEASEEHYSSMIKLLTFSGRTEEADKFVRLRSLLARAQD